MRVRGTYDPEHDALWAAIRRLQACLACLLVALVMLALLLC
jgi:hypothetical protein